MKGFFFFAYIFLINQAYSQTKKQCPKGQSLGTSCFETCDKYWTSAQVTPVKCVENVCICDNGLVKNKNGVCIHPNECPQYKSCSNKNETYISCTGCRNTCQKPNLQTYCDPLCPYPGCACIEGYLRDEKSGKCVAPQDCPCPPGEVFSIYGNRLDTCQNFWTKYSDLPPAEPRPGCICEGGNVRDENGCCIDPYKCPQIKTCKSDKEKYVNCLPCNQTCSQVLSGRLCKMACPNPGCTCIDGYARDDTTKKCIPIKQCPK